MSNKEVLVIGLGAVGAVYAYILKLAGRANVTCVARGNYDATQENGIHLQSLKYGMDVRAWKPDRLFRTVAEAADRAYSHVLITTKALPDVMPLPSLLAPFLSRDYPYPLPVFVDLQNGLHVERDLHNAIKDLGGESNIISTALWIATNLLEGNVVRHDHIERLHIGIYRPTYQQNVTNTAKEAAILQEFAELLEPCGSIVIIEHEVQKAKFKKNFWNASLGTLSALSNCAPKKYLTDPEMKLLMVPQLRAIQQEILSVGRAIGFDEEVLPSGTVDFIINNSVTLYSNPQLTVEPSMLLDMRLGHPLEVEAVVGELVRGARTHRVDIPKLELVYCLLKNVQYDRLKAK